MASARVKPTSWAAVAPGGWLVVVDFKKGQLPQGPPDAFKLAPEVVELVRRALNEVPRGPNAKISGGFTVTTTIDPRLQAAARKAAERPAAGAGTVEFEVPPPRRAIRLDLPVEHDEIPWPPDRSRPTPGPPPESWR